MYINSLTIGPDGQITLTKNILDILGAKYGDELEIIVNEQESSITLKLLQL